MENKDNNMSSTNDNDKDFLLSLKNITIERQNKVVVDDVSLNIKDGEIHAILGESGSGKTTLFSALVGETSIKSGSILTQDKGSFGEVKIKSPRVATNYHIGLVHQEFALVENLTALENIILGNEPKVAGMFIKTKDARQYLAHLMNTYGLKVDLDMKVSYMNATLRKRIEILKVLFRNDNIIIFDEPTAYLSERESASVLQTIATLKQEGKTIFLLTTNTKIAKKLSDRLSIMRKGKILGTYESKYMEEEVLINMMYGRKPNLNTYKPEAMQGPVIFDMKNVTAKENKKGKVLIDDVSLEIRQNEIVSIVSSAYNGQEAIVKAILGSLKINSGFINIFGTDVSKMQPAKRNMVNYVPKNTSSMLIDEISAGENVLLNDFKNKKFTSFSLKKNALNEYTNSLIETHNIHLDNGPSTLIKYADNKDSYKILFAREVEKKGFLIFIEPSKHLDSLSKEIIRHQIIEERDKGKAILIITYDIDEAYDLSDYVYTIYNGRITGKFKPKELTKREIGAYQEGVQIQEAYRKNDSHLKDDQEVLNG